MGDIPPAVQIDSEILAAIYREARNSFPNECCGWLCGEKSGYKVTVVRKCINAQHSGTHPTVSERTAETAYVFSGEDVLDLNKSFDSDMPAMIIYHSHPNGKAYLSETDRQVATSPWGDGPAYPVQQLVIGIDHHQIVSSAQFAWSEHQNEFVEINQYSGAAI